MTMPAPDVRSQPAAWMSIAVPMSAFLQRYVLVGPRFSVVAFHAVQLHPAAVDEIGHGTDHVP